MWLVAWVNLFDFRCLYSRLFCGLLFRVFCLVSFVLCLLLLICCDCWCWLPFGDAFLLCFGGGGRWFGFIVSVGILIGV